MKNHKPSCHHKNDNDTLPSDGRCRCICTCPVVPENAQRTGDGGHICCDGECNHDDCCGKVEANCPLSNK